MVNNIVIAVGQTTLFAQYLERLGIAVYTVGKSLSGLPSSVSLGCEAIYWPMDTVCHTQMRHVVRSLLLSIPAGSIRILDFNLKAVDADRIHIIRESLKCCDLLRIDMNEFTEICRLLGLRTQHTFDDGFELMRWFSIKTLILTHGVRGCHVFHGRAVSEKWGLTGLGDRQSEAASAAFLASYYAASRRPGILFTECHRIAFDYMRQMYEND